VRVCVCERERERERERDEGWAWALCLGCELKGELEIVIQTPPFLDCELLIGYYCVIAPLAVNERKTKVSED
jgi:hypothetical protein